MVLVGAEHDRVAGVHKSRLVAAHEFAAVEVVAGSREHNIDSIH